MASRSFICRPCLQRVLSEFPSSRTSRAFTTTPARWKHGAVPSFAPTPSSALNALLSTLRSNIFLPAHLIIPQRTLLYRKKNHALLTSPDEPATVKLGDEVHQLHPLSHQNDEPNTRKAFAKAVALMSETGDFRNLRPLLEGLQTARRSMKGWQMEKAVRAAMEIGRTGVVMECLRRVEYTGMGLWETGVAREALWGTLRKGIDGGWEEGVKGECVRFAENLWELCWDARHAPDGAVGHARRKADFLGGLMCLFAINGDSVAVEKFGGLMLKAWDGAELGVKEGDWYDANQKLMMWSPVLIGSRIASGLLGASSSLGTILQEKRIREVQPVVEKCLTMVQDHVPEQGSRRGIKLYEALSRLSS